MARNRMLGLISPRYMKNKYALVEELNYCVYFITDGELTKVGIAASLPNRMKQLQTGNGRKLRAMYIIPENTQKEALDVERMLHKCFSEKQEVGEWFNITEEEVKRVCLRNGLELHIPTSKFDFEVDGIQLI